MEDFLAAANHCMDMNEEGIVTKRAQSTYVLDGRTGQGWYKWKRDYNDIVDDIDAVVVGGYFGYIEKDKREESGEEG